MQVDAGWFTPGERAAARGSEDPDAYLRRRTAAKRAVLACLGLSADDSYLAQIEVDAESTRRPVVRLSGAVRDVAEAGGVRLIDVSLSYDEGVMAAFAAAVTSQGTMCHLCLPTNRESPAS